MAGSTMSAASKQAYRMFAPSSLGAAPRCPGGAEEFDEADVWGSFSPAAAADPNPAELGRARQVPSAVRTGLNKPLDRVAAAPASGGSLPMNIPDWQKILGAEYRAHYAGGWELDGDDYDYGKPAGGGAFTPPHELACRNRAASLSVHEGVGRTLKGRDLSRLRDAVWKQTGFQD